MNILITGASGFIGNHLMLALTQQGHYVIAGYRHKINFITASAQIKCIECDYNHYTTPEKWFSLLERYDVDAVINTVGIITETVSNDFKTMHQDTPIALFTACEIMGVNKIIQISALGADESAFSQFHLSKKNADTFLMGLNINWTIVMPSIVYGTGAKSMELFKTMAALPITPLIEDGSQTIQPIHIDDFCNAVKQLISSEQIQRLKINFVGPESITMKQLFTELKQWLKISSNNYIKLPYSLILLLSRIKALMPIGSISADTIKMLRQGNNADVTPFIHYFNFTPASVSAVLNKNPAHQSDRWHAKLSNLHYLLSFSIAFVWIWTAITTVFIYPIASSLKLLAQLGISGEAAIALLYSAALMDFLLGIAILFTYRITLIGLIQISVIVSYSLLISVFIPEHWTHPFGAISKNLPLIVATLIMMVLHDSKQR